MKHRKSITAAIMALAFLAQVAPSMSLSIPHGKPNTAEQGHRFKDKLYGYGWVLVDAKGQASAHALFSNSRKWEGSVGVNLVIRVMAGDAQLAIISFSETMPDALLHGGTIEKHQQKSFSLPVEKWAEVTAIKYEFGGHLTPAECAFWKEKYLEGKIYIDPCA